MISEKHCFYFNQISQQELFNTVGDLLIKDNIVKDNYITALIERENLYPTGFDLQEIHVAIPHVESTYINQNGIWCAVIKNGCKWYNIEDDTEQLEARIVFGLLITDSNKQIELLKNITSIFKRIEKLKELSLLENSSSIYHFLKEEFTFID